MYACIQTCDVKVCFATKVSRVCSYAKSQQVDHKDLLFAHFIITDIISELKNCTFTEIVRRTFYLLYGNFEECSRLLPIMPAKVLA